MKLKKRYPDSKNVSLWKDEENKVPFAFGKMSEMTSYQNITEFNKYAYDQLASIPGFMDAINNPSTKDIIWKTDKFMAKLIEERTIEDRITAQLAYQRVKNLVQEGKIKNDLDAKLEAESEVIKKIYQERAANPEAYKEYFDAEKRKILQEKAENPEQFYYDYHINAKGSMLSISPLRGVMESLNVLNDPDVPYDEKAALWQQFRTSFSAILSSWGGSEVEREKPEGEAALEAPIGMFLTFAFGKNGSADDFSKPEVIFALQVCNALNNIWMKGTMLEASFEAEELEDKIEEFEELKVQLENDEDKFINKHKNDDLDVTDEDLTNLERELKNDEDDLKTLRAVATKADFKKKHDAAAKNAKNIESELNKLISKESFAKAKQTMIEMQKSFNFVMAKEEYLLLLGQYNGIAKDESQKESADMLKKALTEKAGNIAKALEVEEFKELPNEKALNSALKKSKKYKEYANAYEQVSLEADLRKKLEDAQNEEKANSEKAISDKAEKLEKIISNKSKLVEIYKSVIKERKELLERNNQLKLRQEEIIKFGKPVTEKRTNPETGKEEDVIIKRGPVIKPEDKWLVGSVAALFNKLVKTEKEGEQNPKAYEDIKKAMNDIFALLEKFDNEIDHGEMMTAMAALYKASVEYIGGAAVHSKGVAKNIRDARLTLIKSVENLSKTSMDIFGMDRDVIKQQDRITEEEMTINYYKEGNEDRYGSFLATIRKKGRAAMKSEKVEAARKKAAEEKAKAKQEIKEEKEEIKENKDLKVNEVKLDDFLKEDENEEPKKEEKNKEVNEIKLEDFLEEDENEEPKKEEKNKEVNEIKLEDFLKEDENEKPKKEESNKEVNKEEKKEDIKKEESNEVLNNEEEPEQNIRVQELADMLGDENEGEEQEEKKDPEEKKEEKKDPEVKNEEKNNPEKQEQNSGNIVDENIIAENKENDKKPEQPVGQKQEPAAANNPAAVIDDREFNIRMSNAKKSLEIFMAEPRIADPDSKGVFAIDKSLAYFNKLYNGLNADLASANAALMKGAENEAQKRMEARDKLAKNCNIIGKIMINLRAVKDGLTQLENANDESKDRNARLTNWNNFVNGLKTDVYNEELQGNALSLITEYMKENDAYDLISDDEFNFAFDALRTLDTVRNEMQVMEYEASVRSAYSKLEQFNLDKAKYDTSFRNYILFAKMNGVLDLDMEAAGKITEQNVADAQKRVTEFEKQEKEYADSYNIVINQIKEKQAKVSKAKPVIAGYEQEINEIKAMGPSIKDYGEKYVQLAKLVSDNNAKVVEITNKIILFNRINEIDGKIANIPNDPKKTDKNAKKEVNIDELRKERAVIVSQLGSVPTNDQINDMQKKLTDLPNISNSETEKMLKYCHALYQKIGITDLPSIMQDERAKPNNIFKAYNDKVLAISDKCKKFKEEEDVDYEEQEIEKLQQKKNRYSSETFKQKLNDLKEEHNNLKDNFEKYQKVKEEFGKLYQLRNKAAESQMAALDNNIDGRIPNESSVKESLKAFAERANDGMEKGHSNTEFFDGMINQLKAANNVFKGGESVNTKLNVLKRLEEAADKYITEKNKQFRLFPSKMRKARLQFAKDLSAYAHVAAESIEKRVPTDAEKTIMGRNAKGNTLPKVNEEAFRKEFNERLAEARRYEEVKVNQAKAKKEAELAGNKNLEKNDKPELKENKNLEKNDKPENKQNRPEVHENEGDKPEIPQVNVPGLHN